MKHTLVIVSTVLALLSGTYITAYNSGYEKGQTNGIQIGYNRGYHEQRKLTEEVIQRNTVLASRSSILTRQVDSMSETLNQHKYNVAQFELSAYSPFDDVNGLNSSGDPNVTSIGMKPGPNVFAVDPKVIPYKSNIIIIYDDGTMQRGVAGDTGGAIKGNRIDVFKKTYKEAIEFGRKKAIVVWYKEVTK